MALLTPDVRSKVTERLDAMVYPVEVVVYGNEDEESTLLLDLAREIADVSDKIRVRSESGTTEKVELAPALVLLDHEGTDHGIHFYGVPVGYEFAVLLEDLVDLGTGKTKLSEQTRAKLQSVTKPTVIKVFSTPT